MKNQQNEFTTNLMNQHIITLTHQHYGKNQRIIRIRW